MSIFLNALSMSQYQSVQHNQVKYTRSSNNYLLQIQDNENTEYDVQPICLLYIILIYTKV